MLCTSGSGTTAVRTMIATASDRGWRENILSQTGRLKLFVGMASLRQTTMAVSWIIEPDEKINTMTEDGISVAILAQKAPEGGALDIAPRFRYILRVAELPQEDFPAAAARLLFSSALLALPHTVEAGRVTAVALTALGQKCVHIAHGPHAAEAEARPQTTWITQANRHHRAPAPRQRYAPEA